MMRVSNEMLASNATYNIDNLMSNLDQTEQELSTGKQVSQPSDNPVAYAQIMFYQSQINQQNNYLGNISASQGLLQTTVTALGSMQSLLQQAGSLYAEGEDDALSNTDRQSIVQQLNQMITQAVGIANTNYGGQYIFAGSSTSTEPFVVSGNPPASVSYQGDGNYVQTQVNQGVTVAGNIPGNDAFLGGGPNSFNNVFNALINLRNAFQNTESASLIPINNPPNNLSYVATINSQAGNFATTPVGPGPNSFTVNGVTINYDTGVDSIQDIVNSINAANAGVTASVNNVANPTQIIIQSTNGELPKLADVTGNFTSFMQLQGNLSQIEAAQNLVTNDQSTVGSSLNELTQAQTFLQSQQTNLTASISSLQDTNVTSAISNLSLQQTALQSALQSSAMILQQTNLFNFIQ